MALPPSSPWEEPEGPDIAKLNQVLEDDERVKGFKGNEGMLQTAQAVFMPQPVAPHAPEMGAKYARKVAWRDQVDLLLITCTRFLHPSAEGALALAIGRDIDAKINAIFALLDANDMRNVVKFKPGQLKTLPL